MNKKFSFLFLIFPNLYSFEKLSLAEASREVETLLGRTSVNSFNDEASRRIQRALRRHIVRQEVSSEAASRFFRDDFGHANINIGGGMSAFAAPGIVGIAVAGPIGLALFAGAVLISQFYKPDPVAYTPTFREKWLHIMEVRRRFFIDLQKARGKFRHLFTDSQIQQSIQKFEEFDSVDNTFLWKNLEYELTEQSPSPNQEFQMAKNLIPELDGLICTWRRDFICANVNTDSYNYYPYTDRQEPEDFVFVPSQIEDMVKFKTDKDSPLGFRIRSIMNLALYVYYHGSFYESDRVKNDVFNLMREIKRIDNWFNSFLQAHIPGTQCDPECPGISGAEELSKKKCDIVYEALTVLLTELLFNVY
ncbi:hypothetical protein A3F66_01200 [candidate division TM6 bacterium RIFCSPHIGHO2_12_FULL_32_22]|nr:MAG: hypothetical protein A3F66_01200 [candidate division TM6 bacterium RIFCSPHIGHO2_12_FULL_32_22]